MTLLIALVTIFFIIIAFVTAHPLQFFFNNSLFFIAGFGALILLLFRSKNRASFLRFLIALPAGFLLACLLLFLIGLIQLNVYAVLLNAGPGLLGVISERNEIASVLKANNRLPEIVIDNDDKKEVLALAIATTGDTNFYGKYVLASVPNELVLPVKKSDVSMLLIDNTLIILRSKPEDMQAISPVIGYLFVKQYFSNRAIKSFPKVTLLDKNEYLKYREEEENKKFTQFDDQVKKIDDSIMRISQDIQNGKNAITTDDNFVRKAVAGRVINKAAIKKAANDIVNWNQRVQRDQALLIEYQSYAEVFKKQREALQAKKGNLANELGVFEQPNVIKVALSDAVLPDQKGLTYDTTLRQAQGKNLLLPERSKSQQVANYFETLTHEYLHYASFVSQQKKLRDSFFEEGFTEYFARAAIKEGLHTDTNLGYPVYVKIIEQMTKLIPESEFAEIYFTKDEQALESTLDHTYGDNFYENNAVFFESLQYTSDPKQVLLLANTIMKKIGGDPLKERDLMSRY